MTDLGQMLPPSCQTQLSNTELTAEKLLQQLEELESEHKRAKTVRYEFQVSRSIFCLSMAQKLCHEKGKIEEGDKLKENRLFWVRITYS